MLVYIALFVILFAASAIGVWLFRIISGRQVFNQITVASPGSTAKKRLKIQQNFSSFVSLFRKRETYTVVHKSKGDIKTPWGW